jgi:NAD(P)-dependent dehydrogenase (short-subunit alcohol dehydrogenase family)
MTATDLLNLDGKVALITGAGSGFGRHFAQTLAQAGATTVLAARRREKLEETARSITDDGGKAICIELDVTDADSVRGCFSEAQKAVGTLDILVNNAGIARGGLALDSSENDWEAVVDTNLKGVFLVAQAAAASMIKAEKTGSIINIASIAGLFGAKGLAIYGAAKSGVVSLTKSMALELVRYGIRVNALAPGYFVTDLNREWFESDAGEYLIQAIPMRRTGKLEELTVPLLLLASDAGSFMTGSIVVVDGGQTSGPV